MSRRFSRATPSSHVLALSVAGRFEVAGEAEQPAIADGVLTFDEYESLVLATVGCMENAGVRVVHSAGYGRADGIQGGPRLSSRGVDSYFGQVTTYSATPPTAQFRTIDLCKAGSAQVEHLWAQHAAPGEPDLQAMRDFMARCLERSGVSPAESPSDQDLRRVLEEGMLSREAYRECQFQAADAFEIDRLPG